MIACRRHAALLLAPLAVCLLAGEAVPAKPTLVFLDAAAAAVAIADDRHDGYFDRLQPLEIAVKTGRPEGGGDLAAQRAACRQRYREAVAEFTAEERAALGAIAERLHPILAREYPLCAQQPWRFLKLAGGIEGGLPHTRGEHIVFSDALLRSLVASRPQVDAAALAGFCDLLLHEQSHVLQRLHPERFVPLFEQVWGFRRAKAIAGAAALRPREVVNPDGVDTGWVFPIAQGGATRWIWPLLIFSDGDGPKRMPEDFRMVAIAVEPAADGYRVVPGADGKPQVRSLMAEPAYLAALAPSHNVYHPNEAAADLFAKMVVTDHLLPAADPARAARNKAAYDAVRSWAKANLGPR